MISSTIPVLGIILMVLSLVLLNAGRNVPSFLILVSALVLAVINLVRARDVSL